MSAGIAAPRPSVRVRLPSTCSRSASVRATLSSRWAERRDKVSRSQAVSSQFSSTVDNLRWLSSAGRSRNALAQPWRLCCRSRALATITAALALSSPGFSCGIQRRGFPRDGQVQVNPIQQRARQLVAVALHHVRCAGAACRWVRQDIHRGTGSSPPPTETVPETARDPWPGKSRMCPDSKGSRKTSNTLRSNSGSSSRNSTPWWARVISPGCGFEPPPTSAGPEAEWWGWRNGLCGQWLKRHATGDGLNRCHFQRFAFGQRRQQPRQTTRQQRFPGSRWPAEQQVMSARRRNQQCPFGRQLSLHFIQVGIGLAGVEQPVGDVRLDRRMPVEMRNGLQQMIHSNHFQPRRQARFLGIRPWHHQRIARPCAPPKPPAIHRAQPGPRRTMPTPQTLHIIQRQRRHLHTRRQNPKAIARSKRPPSLGRSAGARFSVMRRAGNCSPGIDDRTAHPVLASPSPPPRAGRPWSAMAGRWPDGLRQ